MRNSNYRKLLNLKIFRKLLALFGFKFKQNVKILKFKTSASYEQTFFPTESRKKIIWQKVEKSGKT